MWTDLDVKENEGGKYKRRRNKVCATSMETFAAKVKYRSGPRFDPLLEEMGGWIAGEAQKYDTEMADVVIEIMAKACQPIMEDLNPFKEQVGEILPSNLERNFSGFLMRKVAIVFKVNPNKLATQIALLKYQLLIAKFVGHRLAIAENTEYGIPKNLRDVQQKET